MRARQCGEARCSSRKMPCQVPSFSRPSVTGMLSWVWVSALLDVGRHVVRPFVIVAVERDIFWHAAMQISTEVAPDIGRCILLDQQRRGGVRDVEGEEAG